MVTVTKSGLAMFIVATSKTEILSTLVSEKYPRVRAMVYDSGSSTYHLIADYQ